MIDPSLQLLPKVSSRQLIRRGLKGHCPNCGNARLFRSVLRIEHDCPSCGMRLQRGDGYYLGALCLNYGITVFFFLIPVLLIGFSDWIDIKLAIAISVFGAFTLPVILYRFSWSCWLMIYYLCLPGELHANRDESCDDLSFEEEKRIYGPKDLCS